MSKEVNSTDMSTNKQKLTRISNEKRPHRLANMTAGIGEGNPNTLRNNFCSLGKDTKISVGSYLTEDEWEYAKNYKNFTKNF